MLGNSTEKKMVLISSTNTNEWPQNEHQDMNMSSAGTRAMEKPTQQHQQIPQESLKCPRCDSSNTKFCYYNNYSLSQPRHFCKACKRYWTRGGTLRNVPVGGGCRRNKKIRRSISSIDLPSSSALIATSSNPNTTQPQTNPVFFGLPTNNNNPNSEMGSLPYHSFNPRVSGGEASLGFDLQSQMSGFGVGFSNNNGNYQNGSTNPLLSSYSLFGSSNNSPTIASLLGSSLNQQKFMNNFTGGFQGFGSFEEVQMGGNMSLKVKREEGQNYQNPNFQNHLEQINPSDSTLYWNAPNSGGWFDPTNTCSSIPSLI